MTHSLRSRGSRALLLVSLGALAVACSSSPQASRGPRASIGAADPNQPMAVVLEDDPNAIATASTIRKVTVYSDRAMVTREASVELGAEPVVLVFRSLPGWVDDGSVRLAASAGRILDVRVSRSYLARSTEASYQKAEAEARALSEQLAALDDEVEVLDAQAAQIEDIKAFSLDKLTKDVHAGTAQLGGGVVLSGSVGVETYAAVVDFIGSKLREIAKARREVAAARERIAPELEAANKRLGELRALTQVEETKVFVTLQGNAPGESKLELSYLLPGATWEAVHELRADGAQSGKVELSSYAVVTQASGEDWTDAELSFSTQSSTASVRIPELEALTLGQPVRTSHTTERHSASFTRAEGAFREQNMLWNKRIQTSSTIRDFEQVYQTNVQHLEVVQGKTVQIFQSLEQRGTTAQFKALAPTKVRADGRSVRVPIGRVELDAKRSIVAAPEQSLNAAQVVELTNESGQAILPGAVSLFQSGAFLGVTDVDFVADGEKFTLFQSVADHLKLSRVLDKKRSALVRKTRTQMQLAFVITVENLSSKPTTLELADRVPVAEDKDVVVSGVKLVPDAKPDSMGIVRWPVTLQPKEKRSYQVQYTIEYPPTLVLEMRRKEAAPPAASPFSPSPAAPARKKFDVKDDIERFEKMF